MVDENKNIPAAQSTVQEYAKRKNASNIARIHQALCTVEIKKIPESVFINEILPYYSGTATNLELPKLVAAAAGGPFSEFDVVDSDGVVLFRAPALLERSMFSYKSFAKNDGASIEGIFAAAAMINNRSPREAEQFLDNQLRGRGYSEKAGEIYVEILRRRNEILKRYGVEPPKGQPGPVDTKSSNSPDKPDEFDEFELL